MTPARGRRESHAFWRLKRLRALKRMTLQELATRTALTKSYLSKVERGVSVPSIATALKLAGAFEVGVGDLFGVGAPDKDLVVVRKHERKPFNRGRANTGHRYEAIAPGQAHGLFEAFIVHPPLKEPPGFKKNQHSGQELCFALKGTIEIAFPHTAIELSTGDCIVFGGQLPHRLLSAGRTRAEALVVIVPGEPEAASEASRASRRARPPVSR